MIFTKTDEPIEMLFGDGAHLCGLEEMEAPIPQCEKSLYPTLRGQWMRPIFALTGRSQWNAAEVSCYSDVGNLCVLDTTC